MPLFCRTLLKKVAFFNIRLIAIFFFSLSRAISRRVRIPRVKFGAGTKVELNIKLPRQKKISFQRTFRIFMFCQSCIAPKNVLRRYTPMISYARNQEQKRKRLPLPLPPFPSSLCGKMNGFWLSAAAAAETVERGEGGGQLSFISRSSPPRAALLRRAAAAVVTAGGGGGTGKRGSCRHTYNGGGGSFFWDSVSVGRGGGKRSSLGSSSSSFFRRLHA